MKNHIRRLLCAGVSSLHPKVRGPLVCAGMVRNEIDIIDVWVAHLCETFDQIIIYDHLSTDTTRERLHTLSQEFPNLIVRDYNSQSHDQSSLMTKTFVEVSATNKNGWMFFLDADEFVMTKGRDQLRKTLAHYRAAPMIRMAWVNAHLEDNSETIGKATHIKGWLKGPEPIYKTAVNLAFAADVTSVTQGNHAALLRKKSFFRKIDILKLLHLPIRSRKQLASKIAHGLQANALTDGGERFATHWKEMATLGQNYSVRVQTYYYGALKSEKATPPTETLNGRLSDIIPFR